MKQSRPWRLLFVCIGNSCRSPMAEALARQLGNGVVEASSAGLFPAPIIQPETFQVLAERQVTLEDRRPQSFLLVDGAAIDLVVNMSGHPVGELLRGFTGREVPWEVPDPIGKSIQVYRAARDQIERQVADLIEELRNRDS